LKFKQCLILLAAVAVAACDHSPTDVGQPVVPRDSIRALTVTEQQIASASNQFAIQLLLGADAAEKQAANFMVSPLSASMALGMTMNGAAGETFNAMRQTLGFGALSQSEVNAAYAGLIRQLYARAGTKVQFALANAVWFDKQFTPLPAFVDTLKQYFDAPAQQLDFGSATAPQTISRWAEDKTNGRIKDLVQQIDPAEVMFLVNAVYFKAPWSKEFDPKRTSSAPFTRPDGTRINVPMMSREGIVRAAMTSDGIAVELPYADSAYSIVLWMSGEGQPASAARSILSNGKWAQLLSAMRDQDLMLTMPKFHIEYAIGLNDLLTAMGMGIALDPNRADFSRISGVNDLYISRVFQKTFMDVNEQGTEAAAATSVGVGVTSAPPSITFNKPFLFAVRERSSGTILFEGRVNEPATK
jgi:serine protease inhibitor